jgi:hypothetical protein
MYVRELGAEDWATTFKTTDIEQVRRICGENRMTLQVRPDRSIRTEYVHSALVRDRLGREVFINNALMLWEFEMGFRAGLAAAILGDDVKQLPLVVRFEDGSELPEALARDITAAGEAHIVEINWQRGDVVMVDNRRILHGRRKTSGDDREILVRLGRLH